MIITVIYLKNKRIQLKQEDGSQFFDILFDIQCFNTKSCTHHVPKRVFS